MKRRLFKSGLSLFLSALILVTSISITEQPVNAATEGYSVQSAHPYLDNYSNTWTVSKSGASQIRVHFVYIDTESTYDFVTTNVGDNFTGSYNNVWSNWASGSSINITLQTDYSVTKNGFVIDMIEYQSGGTSSIVTQSYVAESAHQYANNLYEPNTVNIPFAKKLRVHFTYIETESGYDAVTTSNRGLWSGNYYDVWSPWVVGSSLDVCLTSDGSVTMKGYYIDKVEYEPDVNYSEVVDTLDSPHNYTDNYSKTWTIKCPGASGIRVHFSSIQTESGYDYVKTSSGNSWSGNSSDVWSSWSSGDTITITLTSDSSVTGWGFNMNSIETKQAY